MLAQQMLGLFCCPKQYHTNKNPAGPLYGTAGNPFRLFNEERFWAQENKPLRMSKKFVEIHWEILAPKKNYSG